MVEENLVNKECTSYICGPSYRDPEPITTVIPTEDIILPYYYIKNEIQVLESNYTPYDEYAFISRIMPSIKAINKAWSISLIPKNINGTSRLAIELYDGGEFIPLTNELKQQIVPLVEKWLEKHKNYVVVFTDLNTLTYIGTTIPARWIKSVLPFINISLSLNYIIEDGMVFVMLKSENYQTVADSLNESIMEMLRYLYIYGTVIADEIDDAVIVKKWQLTENNLIDSIGTMKMYHILWNNTLFAPNKTQFMEYILAGNNICSISIKNANLTNIKNYQYRYIDNVLIFKANSYSEANQIIQLALS